MVKITFQKSNQNQNFLFTIGNSVTYFAMDLWNFDRSIATTALSTTVIVCMSQTSLIDRAINDPAISDKKAVSLLQKPGIIIPVKIHKISF